MAGSSYIHQCCMHGYWTCKLMNPCSLGREALCDLASWTLGGYCDSPGACPYAVAVVRVRLARLGRRGPAGRRASTSTHSTHSTDYCAYRGWVGTCARQWPVYSQGNFQGGGVSWHLAPGTCTWHLAPHTWHMGCWVAWPASESSANEPGRSGFFPFPLSCSLTSFLTSS